MSRYPGRPGDLAAVRRTLEYLDKLSEQGDGPSEKLAELVADMGSSEAFLLRVMLRSATAMTAWRDRIFGAEGAFDPDNDSGFFHTFLLKNYSSYSERAKESKLPEKSGWFKTEAEVGAACKIHLRPRTHSTTSVGRVHGRSLPQKQEVMSLKDAIFVSERYPTVELVFSDDGVREQWERHRAQEGSQV